MNKNWRIFGNIFLSGMDVAAAILSFSSGSVIPGIILCVLAGALGWLGWNELNG